jgi:hypothetical protein
VFAFVVVERVCCDAEDAHREVEDLRRRQRHRGEDSVPLGISYRRARSVLGVLAAGEAFFIGETASVDCKTGRLSGERARGKEIRPIGLGNLLRRNELKM